MASVFIPIPKQGIAKECSNYHTIALISPTSKAMFKIFHARLKLIKNYCWNFNHYAGKDGSMLSLQFKYPLQVAPYM